MPGNLPARFRDKKILNRLEQLCREHRVTYLGLFGSAARGEQKRNSDVDLLVRFAEGSGKSLFDLVQLEEEMKKIFRRKIDLLTEGSISPYILPEVLKTVKTIYAQ
ncbi:MAG: nucleotidyltransferase family protein [Candidatus Wallbacteria bacterium]|nr:nucleotidyltransferase family protein [Candidatus Wallbacteria bacterium]